MADNVVVTPGTGATIAADEVVDSTLGTVKVQYVKLMDGTLDGTAKAAVGANGLKVDGSGVTQPVSGTFFQATQPVSGTVGVSGSVAVTGTFFQATQPISAAALPLPTGASTAAKQPALGTAGTPSTDVISVQGVASGTPQPVSGTFWQTTQPVSGTFWQATQPVSLATNTPDVTDRSARLLGHVTVDNASLAVTGTFWQATQPVSGTFWQATQPVSGTITANAGTNLNTSALALDATLTGGTQTSRVTDGTNTATVKAASTATVAADKALVVAVSPNNTVAVTGTFWQATQPVSGTFWQATQPVSGTVTANAGTNLNTSALALDATLTGGTARAKITDGTNNAAVKAASTAAVATDPSLVVSVSPNNTIAATQSGTWNIGTITTLPAVVQGAAGTAAAAWFSKNTDGTNVAAVKAASTAVVTTDPALVVTLSQNGYISTIARLLSAAATTNSTLVKSSAGRVFKIRGYNAKAAVAYLKLYNKATAPTVGTDTPVVTIPLKASDMFDIDFGQLGLGFATGIGFGLTGAVADADTTALVAADVVGLNVFYA